MYLHKMTELWQSRRLVAALVRKDLSLKYKGSVLGYLWSLLMPLAMTGIYTLVFGYVLGPGTRGRTFELEHYSVFLMTGIFPWSFFSVSLMSTTQSLVQYGGLLQKVYFPRSAIVLSIVFAQLVHFALALIPLLVFMMCMGQNLTVYLLLVPIAMIIQAIFTAGLCLFLSSTFVFFRDIPLIVELIVLGWFFLTPIIYPLQWLRDSRPGIYAFLRLNPMNPFIEMYHQWIYNPAWFEGFSLVATAILYAMIAFGIGWSVFHSLESRFMKRL